MSAILRVAGREMRITGTRAQVLELAVTLAYADSPIRVTVLPEPVQPVVR